MFKGKVELFKGLKAEEWVKQQTKKPLSVVRFDMSGLGSYSNAQELNFSIMHRLQYIAEDSDLHPKNERTCDELLRKIIRLLNKERGLVVILIDEYNKPILDNIDDLEKENEMREVFCSSYSIIKVVIIIYVLFLLLVFLNSAKAGVFPAMNNLTDISSDLEYDYIIKYT